MKLKEPHFNNSVNNAAANSKKKHLLYVYLGRYYCAVDTCTTNDFKQIAHSQLPWQHVKNACTRVILGLSNSCLKVCSEEYCKNMELHVQDGTCRWTNLLVCHAFGDVKIILQNSHSHFNISSVDKAPATKGTGMGILGISIRDWGTCITTGSSGQCKLPTATKLWCSVVFRLSLGSLSKPPPWRQRECHQTRDIMSKTMAVQVL